MRRVVITGVGAIAPGGTNAEAFFSRLVAGQSSIVPLKNDYSARMRPTVAGICDFEPGQFISPALLPVLDRFCQLGVIAAREAVAHAGLAEFSANADRAGVFWGSGMGGNQTQEQGYVELFMRHRDKVRPLSVPMAMCNAAASQIAIEFDARGPVINYSAACASSAFAIGDAARAIQSGEIDMAIAGGSESLLTYGTVTAWHGLRTLAVEDPIEPWASCRPFSGDRTGLVLGEGGGAIILEAEDHARARGAPILARFVGYGRSNDATHITKPEMEGQVRAMRQALADAKLTPTDIGYINAHGTATLVGDRVETAAIKTVFGDHADEVPVSSTKSMHGHLMGAAGAIEFIVALLALRERVLPPTANWRTPDPECDLDYVPTVARRVGRLNAVMSNSFAFGGSNAVLIAQRYDPS